MATKTKAKFAVDPTEAEKQNEKVLEQLAELGGRRYQASQVEVGQKFTIPAVYDGDLPGAAAQLLAIHESEEQPERFERVFPYKPWDGAVAIVSVFRKYFGVEVVQKNSFFVPAGYESIPISPTENMRVPYGKISVPAFRGTLRVQSTEDENSYKQFVMIVDTAKKNEHYVQALWDLVEKELAENSIYRGKAIDGSERPTFLDLTGIDVDKIVYTRTTGDLLEKNLWTPIQAPELCRRRGISPQRKVLLAGQFGTGKTLGAMWTAKLCQEVGRTFIMCNTKDNNVFECLHTAALYAPALLFVEDIDRLSNTTDPQAISRLLDELDGFKSKGADIMCVFTTNKVSDIYKGVLRPGRLDSVIPMEGYDLDATIRLFETMFEEDEIKDINWQEVFDRMEGFTPAFTKEVGDKVNLGAVVQERKNEPVTYTTEDFFAAIVEVRYQHDLHMGAADMRSIGTLEAGFKHLVEEQVEEVLNRAYINENEEQEKLEIHVSDQKVAG